MRQRPAPETIQAGLNQVAPRFAGARNAVHLPDESEIGLAVEGAEHAFHAATQTVNGARRRATTDAYFRREYHVIASGDRAGIAGYSSTTGRAGNLCRSHGAG